MKVQKVTRWLACCVIAFLCAGSTVLHAASETTHRTALSLDGQWDVADSISADAMPKVYSHKAPVPGLTHAHLLHHSFGSD